MVRLRPLIRELFKGDDNVVAEGQLDMKTKQINTLFKGHLMHEYGINMNSGNKTRKNI